METRQKREMLSELEALMTGFWLTDLANFSAYFYQLIPQLNWIGFYLSDGKILRLGPFMGKPACVEIAFNRGVCGHSFSKGQSVIVGDVHEFPGHIACDPASRSELVLPFRIGHELVGVLDLDSPVLDRFTDQERELLTSALEILSRKIESFREGGKGNLI